MLFPQVIAVFRGLLDVIGLPMNLLVIVAIAMERRFHVMQYILLGSLALSDFLFLVLANSFLIASTAHERWLYGQTMCYLNPFFVLYFYLNTVLHLIAVSYERYSAIVKSPMTYDGTFTKSRVVLMILIWVAPIPFSVGPFVGWGRYVYNPEVFSCEQRSVHGNSPARNIVVVVYTVLTFVLPSLIIFLLNWLVYKTAKTLQQNVVQVGHLDGSETPENQLQEMSRRMIERKAAVDVCIIIVAFVVCFLPAWIVGIFRPFIKNLDVSAKLVLGTNAIFHASSICNPIIYCVRKREFRIAVKKVFRQMGFCGSPSIENNEIGINNFILRANFETGTAPGRPTAPQATQDQDERFNGSTGRTEMTIQRGHLLQIFHLFRKAAE